MVALFVTGLLTGAGAVLEVQKMWKMSRRNRELEAALKEMKAENQKLKKQVG